MRTTFTPTIISSGRALRFPDHAIAGQAGTSFKHERSAADCFRHRRGTGLRRSGPFRDRNGVFLLGDVKSDKNFAILSHGPLSVHEARLGLPEQPSFHLHEKAGHRSAREHDV